jgi:large subunit ribosomal protein L6
MSRIGRKPIAIPAGVEVTVAGPLVSVKGPKGAMRLELTGAVTAEVDGPAKELRVRCATDLRIDRAKHGLYRALLANMLVGVTKGYERHLEIQGVGYKAQLNGKRLQLFVGYNTKVPELFEIPDGVTVTCPAPTKIVIAGIDKQLVGQVAAEIRSIKPPDVYKGKGIRYLGEAVRKLPGKTVGATGTK